MARNPYSVLGVASMATDAEIRAAFRTLAKQYHPDRNKDDPRAEEKFKEVAAAFDVVGDAERRKKFDKGEIDEQGRERPQAHYRQWTGGAGADARGAAGGPAGGPFAGGAYSGGFANKGDFDDLGDIFNDLFGRGRPGSGPGSPRGRDLKFRLEVEFLDAARGAKKRVTLPDGRTHDIAIPAGVESGTTLRLKGLGEAGASGGVGDVFVEVTVKPHPVFERQGDDIHIEAPITLTEAVLGGKITAPTIAGEVSITVPSNTSSGAVLRLKGRGIARDGGTAGDQFVKLKIVLPEGGDSELEEFVRRWRGGERHAPRKHFAGV